MPHTHINDLVYEGCGKVVFGTSFVQIMEFCVEKNHSLFLRMGIGLDIHVVFSMEYYWLEGA